MNRQWALWIFVILFVAPILQAGETVNPIEQPPVTLVWFTSHQALDRAIQDAGDTIVIKHRYESVPGIAAEISEDMIAALQQRDDVIALYPDREFRVMLNESRRIIGADVLESYGYRGTNQAACVLDTGVDYTHPALGGCFGPKCAVAGGYDVVNNDQDPMDDNGHGTHVAGVIASASSLHHGVAPHAKIVALKVCNRGGMCWASDVAAGIDWCITNKDRFNIQAATLSFGNGIYTSATCPMYLNPVIERAYQRGMVLAAASGNDASAQGIAYPACAPHIISVGATYDSDVGRFTWSGTAPCTDQVTGPGRLACFTNRFSNLDLLAPGTFITSTRGGSFLEDSGTSYAAPHVAAAALLLKEVDPSLSADAVEAVLKASGRGVHDPATQLTFPEINLVAALNLVQQSRLFATVRRGG